MGNHNGLKEVNDPTHMVGKLLVDDKVFLPVC